MSSLDVRDVLNLPQDSAGGSSASGRPSKKQKTDASTAAAMASRPNLKGLAREVQSLGGSNPIAIVPQMISNFKKKRGISRKPAAHWELQAFRNSARGDNGSLVLRHWRRQPDNPTTERSSEATAAPETDKLVEDSAFSRYNVKVVVPQYNDDQYNANLQNPHWTREETDYLMELVKDYDLRWPLVWDRYDYRPAGAAEATTNEGEDDTSMAVISTSGVGDASSRTVEDLKSRYYEIAAKMMAVQKPAQYMTQAEYNLHGMMANFKPQQEKLRKAFVSNALTRSREEVREEEALLLEVRRIMARVDRTNEERRELYSRLDFPHADTDISTFKTSAGLHALLQSLMFHNEKSKKRKSLAAGEGASPVPGSAGIGSSGMSAAATGGGAVEAGGRRDSIAASGVGAHHRRDSSTAHASGADVGAGGSGGSHAAGPGKNKKGGPQAERRKLTDQERDVYGVTYHDRLGSGPTFRYEKINKLFTHKSGQQQMRITNILNELDMPARLFMPTSSVTAQFEQLVNAVVQLVDLRKASDKLDGEIKVEEQRKAEREKSKPLQPAQPSAKTEEGNETGPGIAAHKKKAAAVVADSLKAAKAGGEGSGGEAGTKDKAGNGSGVTEEVAMKVEDDNKEPAAATSGAGEGDATADANAGEGGGNGRLRTASSRTGSRPGSSSNAQAGTVTRKRSASVLSVASDKSVKRQKK